MPRVAFPNTLVNTIYFRQGGQRFGERGGQFLGGQMQSLVISKSKVAQLRIVSYG
jgi:hypothetical protein